MKTTIYTLCTAALLLASCANDPAEDILAGTPGTNGGDLPQGTFVIDYTASTGDAQTRIPANERIQSLDYLLYEKVADSNDFLLKHQRSIPGIGEDTRWPLTRENMTWEQREALKDTLNTNCEYKMVFVANAGKKSNGASIWDEDVLENVNDNANFNEGRLVLPPRLFTETDMYYMWSNHDAPLVGSNYNKDNPASMEITLERMINKVEVKLDASLVETDPANDIDKYLNEYLNTALAENGVIYQSISSELNALAENVKSTTYPGARDNLKNYLRASAQTDRLTGSGDEQSIRGNFITAFKEQMTQKGQVVAKVSWFNVSKVQITYKDNGYASALKFDLQSEGNATTNTNPLLYDMDQPNEMFLFYTFGDNETDDVLNQFSSFSFLDEQDTELFKLSGESITDANVQGNHHIIITCDPFNSIDDSQKETFSANIDLETFIDWEEVVKGTMATPQFFKNEVKSSLGGSFNWNLTINYPSNPVIKWVTEVQQ